MDVIEKMARDRGIKLDLGPFVEVDTERRKLITATEQMKAERNKANDIIGPLQKAIRDLEAKGQDVTDRIEQRDKLLRQMKESSEKIKRSDELVAKMDDALKEFLLVIPNIPHASVPVGKSAADNVEVRRSGEPPKFDFAPRPHWELGERAGILDFESAVKIAGARFAVYKGLGARLERALANFFLDVHTREHGYTEILPPFIVNTAALTGVGQLPKFSSDMFHLEGTDLWLTPTSEVELTNLYRDETSTRTNCPSKSARGRPASVPKPARREKIRAASSANTSSRKWSYSNSRGRKKATTSWKRWSATPKRCSNAWACTIA